VLLEIELIASVLFLSGESVRDRSKKIYVGPIQSERPTKHKKAFGAVQSETERRTGEQHASDVAGKKVKGRKVTSGMLLRGCLSKSGIRTREREREVKG
jgi:hypothetical protein